MKSHKNKYIHEFTLVLVKDTELTEELADKLFEAGCDDGSPFSSCGIAGVGFSREAESLEAAIRSAVADVQKAGCTVERVQIESDSPLLAKTNTQ
ncbi:MAG: hypothetical protein ABSE63_15690 [Thermoguttaceae bacterium]|jgi:hypothetical protein